MKGLNFLNSRAKWDGRSSPSLRSFKNLVDFAKNPQDLVKSFHIAGTNGKGQVSVLLASILGAAGNRVGLNTSPHLSSICERLIIDGKPISEDLLNQFLLEVKSIVKQVNQEISYHEAITLAAFLAFKGLDYAVYEVGLGGRLDASNVLTKPLAAAIVSIGLDHTQVLGQSIEKIAFEKAGVIKADVPVFVGSLDKKALKIVEQRAREVGSKVYAYNRDFSCPAFVSKKLTDYETQNIAIASVLAKTIGISSKDIQTGIENSFWPGRFEKFDYQGLSIYFDCAHNILGLQAFFSFWASLKNPPESLTVGFLNDKPWKEILDKLASYNVNWNIVCPDSPRAVSGIEIKNYLKLKGLEAKNFGNNYQAWLENLVQQRQATAILGSVYLVGKLRKVLNIPEKDYWKKL